MTGSKRSDKNSSSVKRKVVNTSVEFGSDVEKILFSEQIEMFQRMPEFKDGQSERYTNLSGYSLIPKRVLRKPKHGGTVERLYTGPNGIEIDVEIGPATITNRSIDDKTGLEQIVTETLYPQVVEERVEMALVWIATQGGIADIDPQQRLLSVSFTLRELQRAISKVFNKKYSVVKIAKSLKVLNSAAFNLTTTSEDKRVKAFGTRITNLTLTSRTDIKDDAHSKCSAILHNQFALDIALGNYAVHDLMWQGRLQTDLSQDLFQIISTRYRNANKVNDYNFSARKMFDNNPYGFDQNNPSRSWSLLDEALKELKDKEVISTWSEVEKKEKGAGRPKIIDKIIYIIPTEKFIKFMRFSHYAKNEAMLEIGGAHENFSKQELIEMIEPG